MTIEVRGLTKRFGSFVALDDVSVDVPGGGLVALLGPSGSGKTTLLRILAGLERPDRGQARLDGVDLASQSARQRNIGLVFQHYALFRHLTVYENIAFALRVRKRSAAEVDARVRELLALIQLESLGERLPSQLSGGQRQRVALARALAARPRVLLLDEPFGALDAQVRAELRSWLRRLHDEIHLTTVFVTHDQDEAFEVADRVVVMNRGKIEQVGEPADVFQQPANDFVMRFLGHVNVLDAELANGEARIGDITVALGTDLAGNHELPYTSAISPGIGDGRGLRSDDSAGEGPRGVADNRALPVGSTRPADIRGRVYVRPHEVDIARAPRAGTVAARVVRVTPLSGGLKIELTVPSLGSHMRADIDWERGNALGLAGGDDVFLSLRRARVFAHAGHGPPS